VVDGLLRLEDLLDPLRNLLEGHLAQAAAVSHVGEGGGVLASRLFQNPEWLQSVTMVLT
jgi:hypothetical protein